MAELSLTISDLVGFSGVALLVGAYGALQVQRLSATSVVYSGLNALAAVLIFISLLYKPNPASMVIEVFWFGISIYGLVKALRAKAAAGPKTPPTTPG